MSTLPVHLFIFADYICQKENKKLPKSSAFLEFSIAKNLTKKL
jgi:hypothetical protein